MSATTELATLFARAHDAASAIMAKSEHGIGMTCGEAWAVAELINVTHGAEDRDVFGEPGYLLLTGTKFDGREVAKFVTTPESVWMVTR